jgi:hypothetical protein
MCKQQQSTKRYTNPRSADNPFSHFRIQPKHFPDVVHT